MTYSKWISAQAGAKGSPHQSITMILSCKTSYSKVGTTSPYLALHANHLKPGFSVGKMSVRKNVTAPKNLVKFEQLTIKITIFFQNQSHHESQEFFCFLTTFTEITHFLKNNRVFYKLSGTRGEEYDNDFLILNCTASLRSWKFELFLKTNLNRSSTLLGSLDGGKGIIHCLASLWAAATAGLKTGFWIWWWFTFNRKLICRWSGRSCFRCSPIRISAWHRNRFETK